LAYESGWCQKYPEKDEKENQLLYKHMNH
jgi:hypothetical protein